MARLLDAVVWAVAQWAEWVRVVAVGVACAPWDVAAAVVAVAAVAAVQAAAVVAVA